MPDRTLADAVADLRLSDKKFASDFNALRRRILSAVLQLEADARIDIGIKVNEDQILSEFAQLEKFTADFSPVATLRINSDAALNDLAALKNIGDDIVVNATVNTDTARADVADLADQSRTTLASSFSQAGDEAGSVFGEKLKGLANGIVGTVGAVAGGFIATALVKGFARLTTIQDATASLTVALGDATKAGKLLDDVLGVVRGTPFNLDQFALAASNMVSFGIEAQKVPGYLTAIGEAAATRGSRANEFAQRLSTIFGQITTSGRIGGEDLLQFSEAGVNALTILANSAGKTAAEMKKLISEGVVPANQALDVLKEGILNGSTGIAGTTNAFAGTMAKLRDTLTGSIGGFSAATARFGLNIIQPFQDALTTGFSSATTVLDKFGGKLKDAFGGLSKGDFVTGLIAQLKDLPTSIDKVVDAFKKIGPALAPLGAILGASGLGSIQSLLGPLGSFIPSVLTNPLIAATAAFALFTPEVRDALLPVVEKLGVVFVKLAGSAGVLAGKVIDDLTPIFVKLIEVVDSLLPLVDTAAEFAITLGNVVVPVIGLFADIINKIPVGVLQALVVAFLAFKAVSTTFGPLNSAAKLLENIGVSAGGASKAVATAGLAIGAAFAGMALSSDDASTRITGAVGAIGSIAAGFAAGPITGAVATAGVAIGAIAGLFVENAKEAAALQKRIDDLSTAFSANTIEVIANADELNKYLAFGGKTAGGVKLLGAALLETGADGQKLQEALAGLNIGASGEQGKVNIVKVLQSIKSAGDDLSNVPQILNALNASFGTQGTNVAKVTSEYSDLSVLLDDIKTGQDQLSRGEPLDLGQVSDSLKPLIESLNGKDLTGGQKSLLGNIIELQNQAADIDLSAILKSELATSAAKSEQFRVGLQIAEVDTKILRSSNDTNELLKLQDATMKNIRDKAKQIREDRVREALAAQGQTSTQIDDLFKLSKASKVDVLDLVDLGGLEAELRKADTETAKLVKTELNLVPPLTAAQKAAKDLADTAKASEEAFKKVTDEIGRLQSKLSETKAIQNFDAGLNSISDKLGEIINASDLKQADALIKSISDQREKVQQLQQDVNTEFLDAQSKANALQDRIAEAKAAGAVRGASLLQRELDKVFDDANKKQGDLEKAKSDLNDFQKKLAAIDQVPLTLKQSLENQAKYLNLSIFDLLITAPTAESKKAFQDDIAPSIDDALGRLEKELKDKGPEAAAKLAKTLRDQLLFGFVSEGLDAETAKQLVNTYFPIDKIETTAADAARATHDAYVAKIVDMMNQPGFNPGAFSSEGISVPLTPVAPEPGAVKRTEEETQAILDNLAKLEAKLALVSPTSIEADAIRGQIQALIDTTAPVSFTATVKPLTAAELSAVFTVGTPVVLPVGVAAPRFDPKVGGGAGGRFDFKDGGIWAGENHFAHIAAAGAERRFAEPETGGEGYIPLAAWKRESSMQVMRQIATGFGYELVAKKLSMPMPTSFARPDKGITVVDADAIGKAVARHTGQDRGSRARAFGERYDHGVTVESGAIVIQESNTPRRTATRLISHLADLAR